MMLGHNKPHIPSPFPFLFGLLWFGLGEIDLGFALFDPLPQ